MITGLEQIEDSLKRGYRKAVFGFVKSRVKGTTSYFIEITKGSLSANVDRIYMTKHDYILAQDLLDKYDEIHKIEKENKQKNKEERKRLKDLQIQDLAEKAAKDFLDREHDVDEDVEEEEPDIADEEDPKAELILGEDIEETPTPDGIDAEQHETPLYTDIKKGDTNEQN